jgi:Protein of unknown function (DUF3558)
VKGGYVPFVFGAALALLLAGCSATVGQPQPTSPATTSAAGATTVDSAANGAPAVADPLTASAILNSPCSALTPNQLSALGVHNAQSTNNSDASGPGCAWTAQSLLTINVGWIPDNTRGLSDLYRKQQSMAYWRPTHVDGYPAVFADAAPQQDNGCLLNTAVNDHLYFLAGAQGATSNGQACVLAQRTAADVIKNLGGD